MRKSRLNPSTELSQAEWLRQRLHSFSEHRVASVVPDEFAAYVRILHPAHGPNGESVTWAEVAGRSGRMMHRLVQFHAISRSFSSASGSDFLQNISAPENGNLPPDLLMALCEVLGRHTGTEKSCWFCLWDGYGWLYHSPPEATLVFNAPGDVVNDISYSFVRPPFAPEVLHGLKLNLPFRSYLLLEGPLDAALDLGWNITQESFVPQSPNLFWPQDHAWCVASEVDLFCTLVAGSEALAETLMADPRFEAWRVSPGDPITYDSDQINV